jgi:hypothetical protein
MPNAHTIYEFSLLRYSCVLNKQAGELLTLYGLYLCGVWFKSCPDDWLSWDSVVVSSPYMLVLQKYLDGATVEPLHFKVPVPRHSSYHFTQILTHDTIPEFINMSCIFVYK